MNYRAAYALVFAAVQNWRRKAYPFEQEETIACPACGGKLHLVQTSSKVNASNTVAVSCSKAFCVTYSE